MTAAVSVGSLRLRLRRLLLSAARLREETAEKKKLLTSLTQSAVSTLASLSMYSGPQSAELFRLSFLPVSVTTFDSERFGVSCRKFSRQGNRVSSLLPYCTSLLTSPQVEEASVQTDRMVSALLDYVNSAIALKTVVATSEDVRRILQIRLKNLSAGNASDAELRVAYEKMCEMERWRRAKARRR